MTNYKDERIEKALARAVELGEIGIQVAAYRNGKKIIDAYTGIADQATGRPVTSNTMFPILSVSKAMTATALHIQVERGLVDYDAPVATYWPAFARNGKDKITVRHVLCHESGIPQMPAGVTVENICDWDWMIRAIEDFTPMFEPGTEGAYQSLVFGWYVGEVVRRTDPKGRPFGQFIRDEICAPLGIEDVWMGLPDALFPRVGILKSEMNMADQSGETPASIAAKPIAVSPDAPVHNRPDVWRACLPGTGVISSAAACARFFGMIANGGELDGVRIVREETVRACLTPRPTTGQLDKVMAGGDRVSPGIGTGGFWFTSPPFADSPGVLCHGGAGGSIGWADVDRNLSIAICHNRQFDRVGPGGHPYQQIWEAIDAIASEAA